MRRGGPAAKLTAVYYAARHLPPGAGALARALRARGRAVSRLHRRGADLGFAVTVVRALAPAEVRQRRWRAGEPVFLPQVLGPAPARHAAAIADSLAMFARLRRGRPFLAELERRLAGDRELRYAGSTIDRGDPREIERVFVDAEPRGEPVVAGLWAKLAWIADDESDRSLRIRFSAGLEQRDDWLCTTDRTAGWVDQFAARAFPECRGILSCAPLRRELARLLARPHRLSERIIYNNAPGGGAVFHHDAEPGQLGVVFSQLDGRTAWLALAKRRLARLLASTGNAASEGAAMAALDADGDQRLWRLLNRDAGFTAQLAARGALFVLEPGDAILLPSHGIDVVAWHSVIALGRQPSLAHSYGLFPRRPDYPAVADPWRGQAAPSRNGAWRRSAISSPC